MRVAIILVGIVCVEVGSLKCVAVLVLVGIVCVEVGSTKCVVVLVLVGIDWVDVATLVSFIVGVWPILTVPVTWYCFCGVIIGVS